MEYESPEVIATYSEDELAAEAAVCTTYGNFEFNHFRYGR